jgi:hypothetical protein
MVHAETVGTILMVVMISALAAAVIADLRHANALLSYGMGLLIGPLAILVALLLKPESRQVVVPALPSVELATCPWCSGQTWTDERRCQQCGRPYHEVPAAKRP